MPQFTVDIRPEDTEAFLDWLQQYGYLTPPAQMEVDQIP